MKRDIDTVGGWRVERVGRGQEWRSIVVKAGQNIGTIIKGRGEEEEQNSPQLPTYLPAFSTVRYDMEN